MASYDRSIANEYAKRVKELRDKSIEVLLSGRAKDHSEYRYSCGYIKALDDSAIIIQEIITDIQKG